MGGGGTWQKNREHVRGKDLDRNVTVRVTRSRPPCTGPHNRVVLPRQEYSGV